MNGTNNSKFSNDTVAASLTFEKSIMAPVMCAVAFAAFLGNCYIVACIPWIRRRSMNANLRWSLSLAIADAWAALLIILGLLFNSYLPAVWNYRPMAPCFGTCLEVFRVGAMLTSVLHLLALSLNHYLSIVDPFKYKLMMTSSRSKLIAVIMWITPSTVLLICFGSVPGQGFQSPYCIPKFYLELIFRAPIFVCFYTPMLTMLVVYGKILRILYRTRKNIENFGEGTHSEAPDGEQPPIRRISQINLRMNSLKSRMKAVTTTLLIVGTFGLGWLPSVIFFVIYCTNCLLTEMDPKQTFYINTTVNSLIILKLLSNPFIYGFRIMEIRYALFAMYMSRCRRLHAPVGQLPRRWFQGYSMSGVTGQNDQTYNGKNKKPAEKCLVYKSIDGHETPLSPSRSSFNSRRNGSGLKTFKPENPNG